MRTEAHIFNVVAAFLYVVTAVYAFVPSQRRPTARVADISGLMAVSDPRAAGPHPLLEADLKVGRPVHRRPAPREPVGSP